VLRKSPSIKIERALAAGPSSLLRRELRTVLLPETFAKLAQVAGHEPEQTAEVPRHTWQDPLRKSRPGRRSALPSTRCAIRRECATFKHAALSASFWRAAELSLLLKSAAPWSRTIRVETHTRPREEKLTRRPWCRARCSNPPSHLRMCGWNASSLRKIQSVLKDGQMINPSAADADLNPKIECF
jgi:hypothetical protein